MEIKKIFSAHNIPLSDEQENQLNKYYELLVEWNQKMNLTSITEYDMVIQRHFLDSALLTKCSRYAAIHDNVSVLDMGTGAGFPGIVLAVSNPERVFTLVDSLQKRVDFLNVVIGELQLTNVRAFHGRAEDYGKNLEFRGQFDFVVSRAVAELPLLLEYCIPFVKKGGFFISYKGPKYKEELQKSEYALQELNAKLESIEEFQIGDNIRDNNSDIEKRFLLFISKLEETKQKYPRRAGIPKKKPLVNDI